MEPGATVNMFFKREIGEARFNLFIRIAIKFVFVFFLASVILDLYHKLKMGFCLCLKHNFWKGDFQNFAHGNT